MGGLLQTTPVLQEKKSRLGLIVAVSALLALVVVLYFVRSSPRPTSQPAPYAASLKFNDIKMSTADNFAGTSVTYIDGIITNGGAQTVSAVTVEVTFLDGQNQVCQRDVLPLHVLKSTTDYDDIVDLQKTPLTPGDSKPFRLTFDHVSAEWAQSYPQIRAMSVTAQ